MAEPLASIVDDHAVDPHAAAAALARLAQRTRDAVVAAVTALAVGLGLVLARLPGDRRAGLRRGLTGFFVAAVARGERGALVARLIGQRSAYGIPEVARAADRMASKAHRHELARALIASSSSPRASSPERGRRRDRERILPHADELLGLAFLMAWDGVKVHPASIALLDRLLGSTMRSPLYSPVIPEAHLRIAIQRLRASIDA